MGVGNNVIYELSRKLAIRIIKLYGFLTIERHEYVMAKQIYRSGTSIGANIAESRFAQSHNDYVSKLSIALKEASETQYWLELLNDVQLITSEQYESLNNDVKTIIGTLVKIIKKLKQQDQDNTAIK